MLVILILSAIITYKLGAVDREYAKRGETPPGYRLIEKWMDQRKARGQMPANAKPAKYGMWRYFWQRWQAMWETLSDEHAIRDAACKQQRLEAAATGQTPPKRPSLREQAGTYWKWVLDTIVAPVGEKKPEPEAAPVAAQHQVEPVGEPVVEADGPRTACEDCGQTLVERDAGWQHPSSNGCPRRHPTSAGDQVDVEAPFHADMVAKVQRDNAHKASQWCGQVNCLVCQEDNRLCTTCGARATHGDKCHRCAYDEALNDPTARLAGQPKPEGAPMTTTQQAPAAQQSGEVVGLMAAISYAGQVAAAHESHSTGGGEGYRASLGQADVGPETIQSAAAAQEASEIAGAAWRLHEAKLQEQLAAKEATTAETGKKDFLLAE